VSPAIGALLDEGARTLALQPHVEDARREAQILMGHALGVPRAWISAHRTDSAAPESAGRFRTLVNERATGRPIAHLTGKREFYGLEFRVAPEVLIPRPDTETLVDAALQRLPTAMPREVLDLGTGCGCIAVALAHERPLAQVTAVDCSTAALEVAVANAAALRTPVEFLQGNWFSPVRQRRFHLIVSNPPYIATGDKHLVRGDLRFEPHQALASGPDGLSAIRTIVAAAGEHLHADGWLLLEHGHDQAEACRNLLQDAGFEDLAAIADLAGIPRVAAGRLVRRPPSR